MGTGVPQADLSIVATGEELRPQGVDSQTPELICVTLEGERQTERGRGIQLCSFYTPQLNKEFSASVCIIYLCAYAICINIFCCDLSKELFSLFINVLYTNQVSKTDIYRMIKIVGD